MKIRLSNALAHIVFIVLGFTAQAQEKMSLSDAIQIAMNKNHGIQIARNNAEIADNLANRGQAGLLPDLNATAGVSYGNNNTNQQRAGNPTEFETKGAETITSNAGVNLNYTLFSGWANNNRFKQLKLNADLGNTQSLLLIESTILQVASAYYNVLRSSDNHDALKKNLRISTERLALAERRAELSGGSKLNVLAAQVDLNKDSLNYLNAAQALTVGKITLNQLLNRGLDEPLDLDSIPTELPAMIYETLKAQMLEQNEELKSSRINEQLSMLDFKIAKSAYVPNLRLSSSYSYYRSEAEAGILELNKTLGFSSGLTLSLPLYAGGTRKAAIKNSKLQIDNAEQNKLATTLAIESDLLKAFKDYELGKRIVDMEKSNLELSQENFDYTKKQYDLGLISNTEYRQAQVNLLLTSNSFNNVRFNYWLSELELLRITGSLITAGK